MTARELAIYKRGGATALAAEADRQLAAERAKKARVRARPGVRAPGKTKAQRDAEADAKQAATYDAVARRVDAETQGRCEWKCGRPAQDPHHIIGGSGKRRLHESPETVAGICRECHRGWDAGDEETLFRAFGWAREHGFVKSMYAIETKIERVIG